VIVASYRRGISTQTEWLIESAKTGNQLEGFQGEFTHGTALYRVTMGNQIITRLQPTWPPPHTTWCMQFGGTCGEAFKIGSRMLCYYYFFRCLNTRLYFLATKSIKIQEKNLILNLCQKKKEKKKEFVSMKKLNVNHGLLKFGLRSQLWMKIILK
jgi:hypothetical protein